VRKKKATPSMVDHDSDVELDTSTPNLAQIHQLSSFFGCEYSLEPVYTFPTGVDDPAMIQRGINEYKVYDSLKAGGSITTEDQLTKRVRCMQAYINAAYYYYHCNSYGRFVIESSADARNPGPRMINVYEKLVNNKIFLHFNDICPKKVLTCPQF